MVSNQVSGNDEHDHVEYTPPSTNNEPTPSSPPPSFRSRASSVASRHLLTSEDPIATEAERTLADTFDDGSDSDDEGNNAGDDRQRLMRTSTLQSIPEQTVAQHGDRTNVPKPVTQIPVRPAGAPYPSLRHNDGVFANLDAKPERGEKSEDTPPVSCT